MFREKLKLKVAENLHEERLYMRLPFPSVKQGMFILLWVSDNVRALYWGIDKYQQKQRQKLDFSVEKIENSAEKHYHVSPMLRSSKGQVPSF